MKHLLTTIIIILTILSTNSILLATDKSQIEPKTAQEYIAEGTQKYLNKDYDAAISCYLVAIEADSTNSEAYRKLGDLYYDKQEYKVAVKYFIKAFELNPNYENAYNLGYAYQYVQDFTNARKFYLKALEYNPEHFRINFSLGSSYFYHEEYDKSIMHLNRVLTFAQKNPIPNDFLVYTYKGLAKAYRKTGNPEEADKYYKKAHEIDPNYVPIEKRIKTLMDSLETKSYIFEDFSSGNFSEKNFINDLDFKWNFKSTESDYKLSEDYLSPPNINDEFASELFYAFKIDKACFLSIDQSLFQGSEIVQFYIDNSLEPKDVREYPLAKGSHILKWKFNKKLGIVKESSDDFLKIYSILVTPVHSPKIKYEVDEYPLFNCFQTKVKIDLIVQNPKDIVYYKSSSYYERNFSHKLYGENIGNIDASYSKYSEPFFFREGNTKFNFLAYRNGMPSLPTNENLKSLLSKNNYDFFKDMSPRISLQFRSSKSANYEVLCDISAPIFSIPPEIAFIGLIPFSWGVGFSNKEVLTGYVGYCLSVVNLYYGYNNLGQNSFDVTAVAPLHRFYNKSRLNLTGGYRYYDKESRFYIGIGISK